MHMERRRLEAARELEAGVRQARLAERFGVSRTTASRWYRALASGGVDALRRRRAKGRPSHLSPLQWEQLRREWLSGARSRGYPDNEWTTSRLATLIQSEFGVIYQLDHVRRLRKRLLQMEPVAGRVSPPAGQPEDGKGVLSLPPDVWRSETATAGNP